MGFDIVGGETANLGRRERTFQSFGCWLNLGALKLPCYNAIYDARNTCHGCAGTRRDLSITAKRDFGLVTDDALY